MARKNRFDILIDAKENAYFKESGTNRSEWLENLNVWDIVGVLYDGAISEPYRVERMTKNYIFWIPPPQAG